LQPSQHNNEVYIAVLLMKRNLANLIDLSSNTGIISNVLPESRFLALCTCLPKPSKCSSWRNDWTKRNIFQQNAFELSNIYGTECVGVWGGGVCGGVFPPSRLGRLGERRETANIWGQGRGLGGPCPNVEPRLYPYQLQLRFRTLTAASVVCYFFACYRLLLSFAGRSFTVSAGRRLMSLWYCGFDQTTCRAPRYRHCRRGGLWRPVPISGELENDGRRA